MAHRTTVEEESTAKTPKAAKKPTAGGLGKGVSNEDRERVFDAFRRWGYLEATLDPLGLFEPLEQPELDALTGEAAEEARGIYCGTVGADFMHLLEPQRRRWIAERLEALAGEVDRHKILERLIRADLFEQVLQARYLRSEEHTSELQSQSNLVCRLLLEKKTKTNRARSSISSLRSPKNPSRSESLSRPGMPKRCNDSGVLL